MKPVGTMCYNKQNRTEHLFVSLNVYRLSQKHKYKNVLIIKHMYYNLTIIFYQRL